MLTINHRPPGRWLGVALLTIFAVFVDALQPPTRIFRILPSGDADIDSQADSTNRGLSETLGYWNAPGTTGGTVATISYDANSVGHAVFQFDSNLVNLTAGPQWTAEFRTFILQEWGVAGAQSSIHALNRGFVEYQDAGNTCPDGVTWRYYNQYCSTWSTPGGDFGPALATQASPGSGKWLRLDISSAFSSWATNAALPRGLLLKSSVSGAARTLTSRSYAPDTTARPLLVAYGCGQQFCQEGEVYDATKCSADWNGCKGKGYKELTVTVSADSADNKGFMQDPTENRLQVRNQRSAVLHFPTPELPPFAKASSARVSFVLERNRDRQGLYRWQAQASTPPTTVFPGPDMDVASNLLVNMQKTTTFIDQEAFQDDVWPMNQERFSPNLQPLFPELLAKGWNWAMGLTLLLTCIQDGGLSFYSYEGNTPAKLSLSYYFDCPPNISYFNPTTKACSCLPGYAGVFCQYSNAVTCNGNGVVDDAGRCVCDLQFSGDRCNKCGPNYYNYDRPTNKCAYCSSTATCSGRGVCSPSGNGACDCNANFLQPSCAACTSGYFLQADSCLPCPGLADSGYACFGNGDCLGDGQCVCKQGYAGEDCRYSDAVMCHGHGRAQADGTCFCFEGYSASTMCSTCASGWYGADCNVLCTSQTCNQHGTCNSQGQCICSSRFTGTHCDSCAASHYGYPQCVYCLSSANCSGVGTCSSDGSCICPPNNLPPRCNGCVSDHFGPTCQACPGTAGESCGGLARGKCDDGNTGSGLCNCYTGYGGLDCTYPHLTSVSEWTTAGGFTATIRANSLVDTPDLQVVLYSAGAPVIIPRAGFIFLSATQLSVPNIPALQPDANGTIRVMLRTRKASNEDPNTLVQISSNQMAVPLPRPVITSTDPASLPTTGGWVWLYGTNFGTTAGVYLDGGSVLPTQNQSHTALRFLCPKGIGSSHSLTVRWSNYVPPAGQSAGASPAASLPFARGFQPPRVTALYPPTATIGGETLTIEGSGFGDDSMGNTLTVELQGKPCALLPSSRTDGRVKCTTPPGQGKDQLVVLTADDQGISAKYAYKSPTVTAVSGCYDQAGLTQRCLASESIAIVLTGSDFGTPVGDPDFNVTVGKLQCSGPVVNSAHTQLTCTIPPAQSQGPVARRMTVNVTRGGQVSVLNDSVWFAVPSLTPATLRLANNTTKLVLGGAFPIAETVLERNESASGPTWESTSGAWPLLRLRIEGEYLTGPDGTQRAQVKVFYGPSHNWNRYECKTIVAHTDTSLECSPDPNGWGGYYYITVQVNNSLRSVASVDRVIYLSPSYWPVSLRWSPWLFGQSSLTAEQRLTPPIYFDIIHIPEDVNATNSYIQIFLGPEDASWDELTIKCTKFTQIRVSSLQPSPPFDARTWRCTPAYTGYGSKLVLHIRAGPDAATALYTKSTDKFSYPDLLVVNKVTIFSPAAGSPDLRGCQQKGDRLLNCPTSGFTRDGKLIILGFVFNSVVDAGMLLNWEPCENFTKKNDTFITCDLPPGAGVLYALPYRLGLAVVQDIAWDKAQPLVQYAGPVLQNITGCEPASLQVVGPEATTSLLVRGCSRAGQRITIVGQHFGGEELPLVTVDDYENCSDVRRVAIGLVMAAPNSWDEAISCQLPAGVAGEGPYRLTLWHRMAITDSIIEAPTEYAYFEFAPCGLGQQQNEDGLCVPCVNGTASNNLGPTCEECEPGYYSGLGASECVACEAGYNASTHRATECQPCKVGEFSARSSALCSKCSAGYANPNSGGSCVICQPGFFAAQDGESTCQSCLPGTVATQPGSTGCLTCPPGTFALNAALQCRDCPAGTYRNKTGDACRKCDAGFASLAASTACSACIPGFFQPKEGQTVCTPCGAGSYSSNANNNTECKACGPGQFSSSQATTCVSCLPGTRSSVASGAIGCTKCQPGYHQSESTSVTCTPCQPGLYANLFGQEKCQPCEHGEYTAGNASEGCSACPAGQYSIPPQHSEIGSTGCADCAPGKFASQAGMTSCQSCRTGLVVTADRLGCEPCDTGWYSFDRVSCVRCANGTYTPLPGAASCLLCAPGFYADSLGSSGCKACEPGRYAPNDKAIGCLDCPNGTFAAQSGAAACFPCAEGRVSYLPGPKRTCETCPAGYFHNSKLVDVPNTATGTIPPLPGLEVPESGPPLVPEPCHRCGNGTFAYAGASICMQCPEGRRSTDYNTECVDCQPGYVQAQPGKQSCTPCLPGRYQARAGQAVCLDCMPGYANDKEGGNTCTPCEPGTFAKSAGNGGACSDCPVGKYNKLRAQSTCLDCAPGFANWEEGSNFCDQCPPGRTTDYSSGIQLCKPCASGYYNDQAGGPVCRACEPGWYSGIEAIACKACTIGTYQNEPGHSSCDMCQPGRFANGAAKDSCDECPPDYIMEREGGIKCKACPKFAFSAEISTVCKCQAGYVYVPDRAGDDVETAKCIPCPEGAACTVPGITLRTISSRRGYWRPIEPKPEGDDELSLTDDLPSNSSLAAYCVGSYCIGNAVAAPGQDSDPLIFYRCIVEEHCIGGLGPSCSEHRMGPLCAQCEDNFFAVTTSGACRLCPNKRKSMLFSSLFTLVLIGLMVAMFYFVLRGNYELFKATRRRQQEELSKMFPNNTVKTMPHALLKTRSYTGINNGSEEEEVYYSVIEQFADQTYTRKHQKYSRSAPSFVYKMKILLSFFQVVTTLTASLYMSWPTLFANFIAGFDFLNLDFIPWQTLGCLATVSYYEKLWVALFTPPVVIFATCLFYLLPKILRARWIANNKIGSSTDESLRERIMMEKRYRIQRSYYQMTRLVLFTFFLIYPKQSSTIIAFFQCKEVAGQSYLLTDLSLPCHDERWYAYLPVAIIGLVLYPIGIPVAYFWCIRRHRAEILSSPSVKLQYGFLYMAYTSRMWWFETVDMLNKVIMTSLLQFFDRDKAFQIGLFTITAYIMIILVTKPYTRKGDDRLALFCQVAIYNMVYLMLVDDTVATYNSLADRLLSVLLIIITIGLIVAFFVMSFRNIWKVRLYRLKQTRLKKAQMEREKEMEVVNRYADQDFELGSDDAGLGELGNVQHETDKMLDPLSPHAPAGPSMINLGQDGMLSPVSPVSAAQFAEVNQVAPSATSLSAYMAALASPPTRGDGHHMGSNPSSRENSPSSTPLQSSKLKQISMKQGSAEKYQQQQAARMGEPSVAHHQQPPRALPRPPSGPYASGPYSAVLPRAPSGNSILNAIPESSQSRRTTMTNVDEGLEFENETNGEYGEGVDGEDLLSPLPAAEREGGLMLSPPEEQEEGHPDRARTSSLIDEVPEATTLHLSPNKSGFGS